MRKLMWFTLGFGAAMAVCAYFWMTEGLFLFAALLGIFVIAGLLIGRRWGWVKCAAVLCLGAAVGFTWFQLFSQHYLRFVSNADGNTANVTAYCTDYSYDTEYGTAVDGVLYLDGKPYLTRFYVNGRIEMEPGDVLKGVFRLKVTTPDGDMTSSNSGKGIFLLAYQDEDAELLKLADAPGWTFPARLREEITNLIDASFPQDAFGFAKALLVGDRSGIDYETSTAFKISGIMHIIAVSGLHVSILFSLVNVLCLKKRWLVALIGIPVLCLFAAVSGFSPSVVRACIMQCLMMTAMLFDREYDGPTELAFSCLVMLAVNPLVITSVSFQLSVGCMVGIFAFRKPIYDYFAEKLDCSKKKRFWKLKRWLAGSVSMTLSAMTLTTPLVAFYFGAVSLVGVLTNLLTLWIVNVIFYGIMLVCAVGALWPGVGALLGSVLSWAIRYVLLVSRMLAKLPLAAVYTRSIYIVAWLFFCYVLLGIFLLSRNRKPVVLLCCGVIGLCIAIGASWLEPMTDDCRMTMLDVGQGQCVLLQSDGKTYMVDCGGSYDTGTADLAAETLLSQGIFRIDGVILTHYDRDHSGGLPYFLSRVPADMIFAPESEDASGVSALLPEETVRVSEHLQLSFGNSELTIFAPVIPDSGNESSLAVLFRRENCDILITGDRSAFGERILMKQTELPDLEILVAGHHGSKDSSCEDLLSATTPDILAISVGENHYGHPSSEVLGRAQASGAAVYRTDRDGNLIFRR